TRLKMYDLAGISCDPCTALYAQRVDFFRRFHGHRAGALPLCLTKVNNPGGLIMPANGTLTAHFIVALQRGIEDQRQDWQAFVQAGLGELVVGPRERGAGFVNLDRSGSLSKVNYVIELRRAGHPRLREITPCHPERECWTGLFVANLLVSDEVLKMID